MKPMFNYKDSEKFFTVNEVRDLIEDLEYNKEDVAKLNYSYALFGLLHTFRRTNKGLSCYDTLGNYCYFRATDKYKFYAINFMWEGE